MSRKIGSSNALRAAALAVALVGMTGLAQAQSKAPEGMPWFFQTLPDGALQSAWETHKAILASKTAIPPKYKSLVGLAVSAQIPCEYCVIANTANARKAGATEQEIREAIAVGAMVRFWSTVLQGNQTDRDKFMANFAQPDR